MSKFGKFEKCSFYRFKFFDKIVYILFHFSHKVLGITDGIEIIGGLQWQLFTCLVIGWILIYSVIRKGLHQSGKVSDYLITIDYPRYIRYFIRFFITAVLIIEYISLFFNVVYISIMYVSALLLNHYEG